LQYLSQARARLILAGFIATSLLLASFPQIDLAFSRLFYAGGFPFADSMLHRMIREATTWFLCGSLFVAAAAFLFNKLLGRNLWSMCAKRLCYLLVVLALGAGLIVNLGFKDHFGRARPRQIAEFGGSQVFTPAFAVSNQCDKNCSFSSGEAASGFYAIALVYAFARRRRYAIIGALAFGATVSLARIAAGAHFLSDVMVSFFVMLLLSDALYYYMRLAAPEDSAALLPTTVLAPAVAPVITDTGRSIQQ
jgi:lipid A 4'-phosphatase